MVEFDVQHSADGVVVLMHDDTVDRTTDGSGCVGDLTLAELQALDAAVGTAVEGTGVVIPTLAEALNSVTIDMNVEIKVNEDASCPVSNNPQLAADVVAAVQALGDGRRVMISSTDAEVLAEVEMLAPALETGLVSLSPDDLTVAADGGFDALHLIGFTVDQSIVDATHERGLLMHAWTENAPNRMETLIGYGVDMIITDEPNVLAQTVDAVCDREDPCGSEPTDDGGCAISPSRPSRSSRVPGVWLLVLLWCVSRRHRGQVQQGRRRVLMTRRS